MQQRGLLCRCIQLTTDGFKVLRVAGDIRILLCQTLPDIQRLLQMGEGNRFQSAEFVPVKSKFIPYLGDGQIFMLHAAPAVETAAGLSVQGFFNQLLRQFKGQLITVTGRFKVSFRLI